MLKPYKVLECSNLDEIQKEVLTYIQYSSINNLSLEKSFSWNFIDVQAFVKCNPLIIDWFKEYKLALRDIAVTLTRDDTGLGKHQDEPPVIAKINFPILNTENSFNLWWDDSDNLIAKHEMLTPIAFNARLPHAVEMSSLAQYPRIVLSCMFFKEPLNLLE
jgi:hypothetical protein